MSLIKLLRSQNSHLFNLSFSRNWYRNGILKKNGDFFGILCKKQTDLSIIRPISYKNIGNHVFISKKNNTQLNRSYIGYWLLGCSSLVFGIVILGGLTRLTESGLSITEWKPITGILPPLSHEEWVSEFEKYKVTPEFEFINKDISLSHFKFIYNMEWGHRLLGRIIGIVFVLPAAYFIIRKKVTPNMTRRLVSMGCLLGLQGFIGWWMVKSGLKHENFKENKSIPRVSQYRLAIHLGAALSLYIGMLWTGLDILKENKWANKTNKTKRFIFQELNNPRFRILKRMIFMLSGLVFITALSGALVAGLDAGLIYNTFPYMGTSLIPPKSELFSEIYSSNNSKIDLWLKNMFENPVMAQFNHRILGTSTFILTSVIFFYSRRMVFLRMIPMNIRNNISTLMAAVCIQVILGISTLVHAVPILLATMHQANSLIVLTSIIVLGNRLSIPNYFLKNRPVCFLSNHFKSK
ncbi:hypothetical protein T552_00486 [Pneumocystis carinii B80]|uniref:Cytochrome c oxidase assembly protein COX15 n=1 Tax=Pneumocystis carinii (strain B80) TaxID=1408658 RepID=A0A0W4ZQX0_PNEC8|nr:hypothetical protein T552_00486 [Pneumocystis carinii B80]KTW30774.1 hypothetical protein T552_00486 [Pneumocystis carinii B80]